MRTVALRLLQAALLAGPTALAFASGGYFASGRLVAVAVALAAAAAALLAAERAQLRALMRSGPARAALGGLALLAAWTALSADWAPLHGPAVDARERVLLYLAALLTAALAFRPRAAALWAEPALAAGTVVVIGYGILGQGGVLDLHASVSAGGRLEQPLTYWNAEGALAALGFVLCVRLAGSRWRPAALRLAAAGAAPLLALGVYLTFSRGALTALGVGVAVLLALSPGWAQLRALAIALEGGVVAVMLEEALPHDLLIPPLLAALLLTAAFQAWSVQAEAAATTATGPLPAASRVRTLAWLAALALALAPFAAGVIDRNEAPTNPAFGATATRLGSAGSHRYAYWRVALKAFASAPVAGVGAGGFEAEWQRRRPIRERVRNAHSLELQTAAELGLAGLALLLLALGGVAAAARRVRATDPALAAGPAAALAAWLAHSAIDWDWELPALTLVAAVLAGVLVAQAAAQLGEQRPLAPQREHSENGREEGELEQRLPERPLATPQQPA